MQRTAEWRRNQDERHKKRERARSLTTTVNLIRGTETKEEAIADHDRYNKRRVGRMFVSQSSKCQCSWCASRKVDEPLNSILDSWYGCDGVKTHFRGRNSLERRESSGRRVKIERQFC